MVHSFGTIAAVVLVAILGSAGCHKSGPEAFGQLTVDQVADKLGKPGVFVYDNNPQERYAKGHVPGAKWVDYEEVSASDLPADKAATLIFYCANER
ncbi:MAG TPA: rhodanese-like domain-containing protein [Haliangiales bacterium]|nr:rhodanese-like domain-containing protein [Haliangiales bacterium]